MSGAKGKVQKKRVVIESRESRLARLKAKNATAKPTLEHHRGAPEPADVPRPLSASGRKKGLPGMSKKGDARRRAAAQAPAPTAGNGQRFDTELVQLSDPSLSGAAMTAGVVNNEHAVLSRSAGVYLKRDAEVTRVTELLRASRSTRSPAVLVATSGAGKSTFLAHSISQLRAENSFDTVLAVFVGATDGSTSIYRICTDLLLSLRSVGEKSDIDQQPEDDDDQTQSSDFQGLVAQLSARLDSLSAIGHKTCLVFDAINELDDTHAARSLRWLPSQVPEGCAVLLSTICDTMSNATTAGAFGDAINSTAEAQGPKGSATCIEESSTQEIMMSLRSRWGIDPSDNPSVMFLPTLSKEDRIELLRQLVVASGGEAFAQPEVEAALGLDDSTSPLFLKLLAQNVATVDDESRLSHIQAHPPSIVGVFDSMLVKLDNIPDPTKMAAGLVLCAVHCTQGGLYLQQLKQLLQDTNRWTKSEVDAVWEAMLNAGLSNVVHVGSKKSGAGSSSTFDGRHVKPVGFVHMQARDAVKRRYLADEDVVRREHRRLGTYFSAVLRGINKMSCNSESAQPRNGATTLLGRSDLGLAVWRQCLRRVPLHHALATNWAELREILCSIEFVEAKASAGLSHELLEDFDRALRLISISEDSADVCCISAFEDFRDWVRRSQHILSPYPSLARQLALNERDSSFATKIAAALSDSNWKARTKHAGCDLSGVTMKWMNKPQNRPACMRTFTGFGGLVWALDVSRNGKMAAIGGSDKCVHVVELATGLEVATLAGHTDDITFCCFNPTDDKIIISAADKDPLFCWNVPSSTVTSKLQLSGDCNGLTWSADGVFICSMSSATGSRQKVLQAYEIEKTTLSWQASLAHDSCSCAFGPDGRVACGDSNAVCIWTATTPGDDATPERAPALKLIGHSAAVRSVAWSEPQDSTVHLLASSSSDETVRIWNTKTGGCLSVLAPGGVDTGEEVISVCFDLSGNLLTASSDKTVRLWALGGPHESPTCPDIQQEPETQPDPNKYLDQPEPEPEPEPEPKAEVPMRSSDSDSEDEEPSIKPEHDAGGWVESAVMRGHSNGLRRVVAIPKSHQALSAGDDGSVRLWSLTEALTAESPAGHTESITACAWCMREGVDVVVSADGKGNVQCQAPYARSGEESQCPKLHWRVKIAPVSKSCEAIASMVACSEASAPGEDMARDQVACAMYRQIVILSAQDGSIVAVLPFSDWANACAALNGHTSPIIVAGGDASSLTVWRARAEPRQPGATPHRWDDDAEVEQLGNTVSGDVMCVGFCQSELATRAKDGDDDTNLPWLFAGTNVGSIIVWNVGATASVALFRLNVDASVYGSAWVLSVWGEPMTQHGQCTPHRLLGAAVGGKQGAAIIWKVPLSCANGSTSSDNSSSSTTDESIPLLELEPYAQRIGCGPQGQAGTKGGVVWGSFVQLPGGEPDETTTRLPAVVTATTAKALTVWRIDSVTGDVPSNAVKGDEKCGQPRAELQMVGLFPSSGTFGSPDGIGGQAAILWTDAAATDVDLKPRLAIGDQGGLLYTLTIE